jgi:hypothetical protein
MSVRRAEFPLLENMLNVILTFNAIEAKESKEREKRERIAKRRSMGNNDLFERLKSEINSDSLLDHEVDFEGVNPEVRKIILDPKKRPILLAASHTRQHLRQKRAKRMEKPSNFVKTKIKNVKDRTKSDIGKTLCDITWMAIQSKLGL